MIDKLNKISSELRNLGQTKLAERLDEINKVYAKKSSPLKELDDDSKKKLNDFLTKTEKHLKDSLDSLNEFYKRLRYFEVDEGLEDLGIKEFIKQISDLASALKEKNQNFYVLSFGKKHKNEKEEGEEMEAMDVEEQALKDFWKGEND